VSRFYFALIPSNHCFTLVYKSNLRGFWPNKDTRHFYPFTFIFVHRFPVSIHTFSSESHMSLFCPNITQCRSLQNNSPWRWWPPHFTKIYVLTKVLFLEKGTNINYQGKISWVWIVVKHFKPKFMNFLDGNRWCMRMRFVLVNPNFLSRVCIVCTCNAMIFLFE